MKYSFVEPGKYIAAGIDDKLFLDVGNALTEGIIDHHQPDAPKHSATYLVYKNTDLLGLDVKEIVLHISPDLDCIAASYLANYYIKNKCFPEFAEVLARFVDKMDFGQSAGHIVSLHSLYAFVKQECKNDIEMVLKGHELIEKMASTGYESGRLPDSLMYYAHYIENDYKQYLNEYESTQTFSCNLPLKNIKGFSTCQAIILKKPQSKLFKTWARNDTEHTSNGFELLIVRLSERRTVISVKADGMFYLKGLGDLINQAEKKKMQSMNIHVDGENRPGYDIPDPWYDGRNPSHNYTIIDSPRRGSELDFEEVLEIVTKYCEQ